MDRLVPHHFSAHTESWDSIRLEGWNEDGTHEATLGLSVASALDLIVVLSTALRDVGPQAYQR